MADAVLRLHARWKPSSGEGHTYRLIEELIDPAVMEYSASLPKYLNQHLVGAETGTKISQMIWPNKEAHPADGMKKVSNFQRKQLRAFTSTNRCTLPVEGIFIAILETIIDLLDDSARKRPRTAVLRGLSSKRIRDFCQFCGEQAEASSFAQGNDAAKNNDPDDKLTLSTRYCSTHRPKFADGRWNYRYRKATRTRALLELELARLSISATTGNLLGKHASLASLVKNVNIQADNKGGAKAGIGSAKWGDPLVDSYIYHYVSMNDLAICEEAGLRSHARGIVDANLSDRKKQILILLKYGASQSDIAQRLQIHRQTVSKELASIPTELRRLPSIHFPLHIIQVNRT